MLEPIVTSIRHCAASWGCLLAMYSSSTALITLSLMAADRESLSGFSTACCLAFLRLVCLVDNYSTMLQLAAVHTS